MSYHLDIYNTAAGRALQSKNPMKKFAELVSTARTESILGQGEDRKVYLNNSFSADLLGAPIPIGKFSKISGFENEWELESYAEGGENGGMHFFPKMIKHSRVVFEYGMGFTDPLLNWFSMTKMGVFIKYPMMVYLLNEKKVPIKIWMMMDVLPVKYTIPSFDAMASEVVINRIEFMHNGVITVL